VVNGNGAPGGYRWGAARKQKLLAREASAAPRPR
jgi:O6-methylguanine-DNA--protein-cysteine methyltransferase